MPRWPGYEHAVILQRMPHPPVHQLEARNPVESGESGHPLDSTEVRVPDPEVEYEAGAHGAHGVAYRRIRRGVVQPYLQQRVIGVLGDAAARADRRRRQ